MRFLLLYADADEEFRAKVEEHLAPLKFQGRIETWHVRKISAEAGLPHDFAGELENANLVLFLISSAFLNSPFCYGPDAARALARNEVGTATLLAVIVRQCDWRSTPLGKLQALPRDGKPIQTWTIEDEAYTDVARRVRELIQKRSASPVVQPLLSQAPVPANLIRNATSSRDPPASPITFKVAAQRYLRLNQPTDPQHARQEKAWLDELMMHIGQCALEDINDGVLEPFVTAQKKKEIRHHSNGKLLRVGVKSKTINMKLGLVRKIVRLAHMSWRDDHGLPLLRGVPLISMLESDDERDSRVLTWEEQREHLTTLPMHLERMARFILQCGGTDDTVCRLRWEWEVTIPELDVVAFLVPTKTRNGEVKRILVCNSVARRIVDSVRGDDDEYVFVYQKGTKGTGARRIQVMNNSGWRDWRGRAGLGDFQVRDLRNTFAVRLREAGVPQELRDEILWLSSGPARAAYNTSDVAEIFAAVEKVAAEPVRGSRGHARLRDDERDAVNTALSLNGAANGKL